MVSTVEPTYNEGVHESNGLAGHKAVDRFQDLVIVHNCFVACLVPRKNGIVRSSAGEFLIPMKL
jgi:hypothetical protein